MLEKIATVLCLLVVFSLPFANIPGTEFLPRRTQLTEVFAVLSILATICLVALRKIRLRKDPTFVFAGLYLLTVAVSTAFSADRPVSYHKLAGILYLVSVAVVFYLFARDAERIRLFVVTWLLAATIVSVVSVIILALFYLSRDNALVAYGLSHYGTLPEGNYPRIRSTFFNPNMLCNYLVISWLMLIAAYRFEWLDRMLLKVIAPLILVAVFFTFSPGIGAILLCTGLWFLLAGKAGVRGKVAVAAAAIILSFGFLAVVVVKLDKGLTIGSGPSARVLTWTDAVRNIGAHPLTGKGIGTMAVDVRYDGQRLRDAHNLFLNVGAESGLPAMAAILALGVWLVRRGWRPGSERKDIRDLARIFVIGFAGAFFYQGLTGSFEDARHLWVFIGVLAAVSAGWFGEDESD